jgi:hypothetical protein
MLDLCGDTDDLFFDPPRPGSMSSAEAAAWMSFQASPSVTRDSRGIDSRRGARTGLFVAVPRPAIVAARAALAAATPPFLSSSGAL